MHCALRLEHITHRFGKVLALDGLDLAVPEGEIYGFLGRNGAGKTTTLRLLMGLMAPDAGRIELFGEEVRSVPVRLKRRIGFVPQEPHFYPWMTARQLGRFVGGFYPQWDDAGFDLNLVLNDYALQLRRWSDDAGAAIDAMARPRGLLVRAPGQAGIAVQLDRPLAAGEQLVVQFRPRPDSRLDDVTAVDHLERDARVGGRPVAWLPLSRVAGNQVCYQLGVRNRFYDMVEPWQCLALDRAAAAAGS